MINQATVDLVKQFEGLRTSAYKDSAGVWTIGYGTTARAKVGIEPLPGMTITEAEAEYYLQKGLEKFSTEIAGLFTLPVNENEFGAFVSLAYNIGTTAFKRSSALRKFNAGDKAGAAKAILLWNKAGGVVLKGLVRRREAERKLFLTPVAMDSEPVASGRNHPTQSTTLRAAAMTIGSGVATAANAFGMFGENAQIVLIVAAAIVVLAGMWIARERLKRWANGDR